MNNLLNEFEAIYIRDISNNSSEIVNIRGNFKYLEDKNGFIEPHQTDFVSLSNGGKLFPSVFFIDIALSQTGTGGYIRHGQQRIDRAEFVFNMLRNLGYANYEAYKSNVYEFEEAGKISWIIVPYKWNKKKEEEIVIQNEVLESNSAEIQVEYPHKTFWNRLSPSEKAILSIGTVSIVIGTVLYFKKRKK